jgi:hypothetical protein
MLSLQQRAFDEMRSALEQTSWVVEDVKIELNKLYEYVTPEVFINEIYWRIKDNVDSLDNIVKMSLPVVGL